MNGEEANKVITVDGGINPNNTKKRLGGAWDGKTTGKVAVGKATTGGRTIAGRTIAGKTMNGMTITGINGRMTGNNKINGEMEIQNA